MKCTVPNDYNQYPADFVRAHLYDKDNIEMVCQSLGFWKCLFNKEELKDKKNYTGRWISVLDENFQDYDLKKEACLFLSVLFSFIALCVLSLTFYLFSYQIIWTN